VVSDQAGISDWVIDNRAGIVVPQEVSRIVEAMKLMVHSPEDFRINAQKAKFRAQEEFNHQAVAKRMLAQYERILRGTEPAHIFPGALTETDRVEH
jgi:glycosyltransferase involved in cell wall biosynthesis